MQTKQFVTDDETNARLAALQAHNGENASQQIRKAIGTYSDEFLPPSVRKKIEKDFNKSRR